MALPDTSSRPLATTLRVLVDLGVVPADAALLARDLTESRVALRDAVVHEVDAFSASGNPRLLQEMEEHAGQHLQEILRLLAGGEPDDLAFVRAHAHRRAEQRFPLEAVLHAYRCGHKVLVHRIRELAVAARPQHRERVVIAVADFAIEYTNAISTVLTAEYVERTRVLAEGEGDRRTHLLNLLLNGHDESDGRVSRLLRRAGYLDERQVFCVVLAQSTDPLEMENEARAQRIVEALSQALRPMPVRTLVGIREHLVTAVIADVRRTSGWTAPRTSLTDRIHGRLDVLGPAVLIGLSNDQPSTSYLPRALHEATVALDFASVTARVVQFSQVSVRRLLLHRGGDYVQSAMPAWMFRFRQADAKADGSLLVTVRALADADLNVQRAARALRVHPNTLYARIERINTITGLEVQRFHDLTELLLAADCPAVPGEGGYPQ